jgi:hypothetical protein
MMPFFSKNFTMVVQFDRNSQTLFASRFDIVNGSYTEPVTMACPFNEDLLGSNLKLFKALRRTQIESLFQGLVNRSEGQNLKNFRLEVGNNTFFSFVAVNQENLMLRVVFCGVNENTKNLSCIIGLSYNMAEGLSTENIKGFVRSLQITEHEMLIILPRTVYRVSFDKPAESFRFSYPDSMVYLQFFKNRWFGLTNENVLFTLQISADPSGDLVEKKFYPSSMCHNYSDLVATENYLLGVFKDSESRQGVAVIYYMDDNFFEQEATETDDPKFLMASEIPEGPTSPRKIRPAYEKDNATLRIIHYYDRDSYQIKYFHEWNGKILMFGGNLVLMLSAPPTVNPPPGMKLAYQSLGKLNRTYTLVGENIVYLLPIDSSSDRCASLTTRMLNGTKPKPDLSVMNTHLFLNDIVAGSTVLNFEQFDYSELPQFGGTAIDVYFKENSNYVRSTYVIKFKYEKHHVRWLMVAVGVISLVFLAIFLLCVAKIGKAMRGRDAALDSSAIQATLKPDTEAPFLNQRVPERFKTTSTEWHN